MRSNKIPISVFPLLAVAICHFILMPLSVEGSAETKSEKADLPDLSVAYISRTPRYPAYQILNESGLPLSVNVQGRALSSAETAAIRRWPNEDEEVIFTATIVNHSDVPSGEFDYVWYVDDKPVANGTHDSLDGPAVALEETDDVTIEGKDFAICRRPPNTVAEIEFKWKWKKGEHRIACIVDPQNKTKEICETNNRQSDRTDALALIIFIDRTAYNNWMKFPGQMGSYCFEDWLKSHVLMMHKKFRESIHPLTPDGIIERIRIDAIRIQADDEERDKIGSVKHLAGWDCHWDFTGCRPTAEYCIGNDWELLASWGHQLGLMDLTMIDTSGGNSGNKVKDSTGMPVLLGFNSSIAGIMRSPGDNLFCEHSAYALNAQKGRRRGYVGDYLFDTPKNNYIQVLDMSGEPVSDAEVIIYQHKKGIVDEKPVQKWVTDRKGILLLDSRPNPFIKTDSGFTLKDNPFGRIDVTGANGVLFLVIQSRGVTDYHWLSIIDFNLAYWRGNREKATYLIRSYIPSTNAPNTPRNIRTEFDPADNSYTLLWDKPSDSRLKTMKFNIYKRENAPLRWELVRGNIQETSLKLEGTGRYTVMTVDKKGNLSAPSPEVRIIRFIGPWGIAVGHDGTWIIKDVPQDFLAAMQYNGTPIGMIGSDQLQLANGCDLTINTRNQIIVTDVTGNHAGFHGFHILTRDGFPIRSIVNEKGNQTGFFNTPKGISVDKEDRIIVADTGNHRIQVFSPKGDFLFKVGEKGSGLDQFQFPAKAIIDSAGLMYIADTGNDRIQIMEPAEDSYVTVQEIKGLEAPAYIALDGEGYLYISNTRGNSVEVYHHDNGKEYKLVNSYTGPEDIPLKAPVGIAIDRKNKRIAIVDSGNHRILFEECDDVRSGSPEKSDVSDFQ